MREENKALATEIITDVVTLISNRVIPVAESLKDDYTPVVLTVITSTLASVLNGWADSINAGYSGNHKEIVLGALNMICDDVIESTEALIKRKELH